jgi:hypothetical protein
MKIISFLFIFLLFIQNSVCQPSGSYSEEGIAFHGLLTANGEIFNNHDFTAAHTKLPFNTILLVTNLENGKSTVVRVNDRGPFAKKRIIDLSRAAARKLGMINDGIIEVDIQELNVIQLSKEREDIFKKNELLDVNGKPGNLNGISVNVWDSQHLEHVLYMIINLSLGFDYDKIYVRGKGSGKARRYSIIISNIKTKEEAQKLIIKLKGEGYRNARII